MSFMTVFLVRKKILVIREAGELAIRTSVVLNFSGDQTAVTMVFRVSPRILAAAGAVAMAGVELENFFIALMLLGVGWNFGFIGATTMLTSAQRPEERGRLQGLNDLVVFGGVTVASFSSGGLMNCASGSVQGGWQMVNMAMLPFLVLAGGALIWLWLRPQETRT